jgi:hypothetical protein
MSQGISLHIGLNHVNPDAYNGWDGALAGCINDANAMHAIARSQGFSGEVITEHQATSSNVVAKLSQIAGQLQAGDIFLLTYSGHGGQIPDQTGEETDGMTETWVLWDRELLDNELYAMWSRFAPGVRIFVSSDSCHSGTVVKMMYQRQRQRKSALLDIEELKQVSLERLNENRKYINAGSTRARSAEPKPRFIPVDVGLRSFADKENEYRYYAHMAGAKSSHDIRAQLIFISGCQDNQYSYDGDDNGLFTSKLLNVWNNGGFSGNHLSFYNAIGAQMPSYQTPNFMTLGTPISGFEEQRPYTLELAVTGNTGSTGGGTSGGTSGGPVADHSPRPSASIPSSWGRNNDSPTITVHKGENPYYYLEIAAEARLFDSNMHGQSRNANNFYATWQDENVSNRLTQSTFRLPSDAWNILKENETLYVKVGTTSSSDMYSWDNHMVSVNNNELANAPAMQIVGNVIQPAGPDPVQPQPGGGQTQVVISDSVGRNATNKKEDVRIIQELLNSVPDDEGGPTPDLTVDGLIGNNTIRAIERFQQASGLSVDGKIGTQGETLAALSEHARAMVSY